MNVTENFLENNLASIPEFTAKRIQNASPIGSLHTTKSGVTTIEVDGIFLHSKHDPVKEAERFITELPFDGNNRVYLLLGAGLGYVIPGILEKPNAHVIWLEPNVYLIKKAFELYDFSEAFNTEKLQVLIDYENEEILLNSFKGKATYPITFVPHRSSFHWKESEYGKMKLIAEQHFHKKDVNLATLTRFEKIWAKNLCFNIADLISMVPIQKLFGIAKGGKVLVAGAGPSLFESAPEIKKYREHFVLIAVDTALPILQHFNIEPDLVYSVDPQVLNSQYLESYTGNANVVFDPTSTYVSLRLKNGPKKGFFTSSPFPLIKLIEEIAKLEIGNVPFGGSVSTNAASLGTLMGADTTYLVGQDLAFTNGYAHSKGAIMEERLNYKESRKFRRELHNFKQLFALDPKQVKGKDGEIYHTNEKMLIFKKWFENHASENKWVNLTKFGAKLENIPNATFESVFKESDIQKSNLIRNEIIHIIQNKSNYLDSNILIDKLNETILKLNEFLVPVRNGLRISGALYQQIRQNQIDPNRFQNDLKAMDKIDEVVSSKRGLNEILSLGIQRTILSITEGYNDQLTIDEKQNERLGIAKKSVLLYEGLYDSIQATKRNLKRSLYRLELES
ncbi:MAG: 6-hydroxymethylpterin diphosphokinase MptE-like protein [Leptospira sp.]|nr:6-hydroxymethylpterin diphosphokinase MptE-like protein [Leptospira sp.]